MTIVYIDGFNLYYGVLKKSSDKWLDLEKYFNLIRSHDNITAIKYFTAIVKNPDKQKRQTAYINALKTTKIKIILGKYKDKTLKCHVQGCNYKGIREFIKPEEKRTDVNIAIHMVQDALLDKCKNIILVSGDSDLVPALQMIRNLKPEINIFVYVPTRDLSKKQAGEIRRIAKKNRFLPLVELTKSQFPEQITNKNGNIIKKSESW